MVTKIVAFFLLFSSIFLVSLNQPDTVLGIGLGNKMCGISFEGSCVNCTQEIACANSCRDCDCGANCNICDPGPTTCGTCSASCGGGTKTCTNGCDSWDTACNTQACCTPTAPDKPIQTAPTNGQLFDHPAGGALTFSWGAIAAWGTECTGTTRRYDLCIKSTSSTDPCTNPLKIVAVSSATTPLNPPESIATTVPGGTSFWAVRAVNKSGAMNRSLQRSFCVEKFNASNTAYVSAWSAWTPACGTGTRTRTCKEDCGTNDCVGIVLSQTACNECGPTISAWSACSNVTHTRTRTCSENCGTNDCAGVALTEDCTGTIRGTLFDASNRTSCPAPNANGYLGYAGGILTTEAIGGRVVQISDHRIPPTWTAPHPWPVTQPTTGGYGNYTATVLAPSVYEYDFSNLADKYVVTPKLTCTTTLPAVNIFTPGCTVMPCYGPVKNVSFGFTRVFGGWWQAQGGSVHGEGSVESLIPETVTPVSSQVLILPDANTRYGLLTYDGTKNLGSNPNAKVSAKLWEKQSSYQGPIYNYDFYHQRFNLYPTTTWDGTTPLTAADYNDGGRGYQIFRVNNSIPDFDAVASAGRKLIFEVNGDVTIDHNIAVASGAFLTVIAKGTITFTPDAGSVAGWYVGNNIAIPCRDTVAPAGCDKTDTQFVGNGTFIGWSGISLSRNLDTANNTTPAEKFNYRRSLYTAAPDPMKVYSKTFKPFIP